MKGVGGMFAKDDEGKIVSREATCICGKEYRQQLLGERFMAMVEAHGEAAVKLMLRELPGLYTPPDCPSCTRRALAKGKEWEPVNRLERQRTGMRDRERFARNVAQLCAAWNRPMDDETSAVFWKALSGSMTDDEFERGVLNAVRCEKKWPVPATVLQHGRAAA